ncbi:hypothetical protein ACFWNC_11445 [Streptomyces sp. NPDC058369]|uniref:hypothetical protein n=1 Tax=unclassified Streptomyces TaxID=2593676 RepID=UPI0011CDBCF9|nr:hypothetical protein EAO73_03625 [Streptomyces sp. col6]
MILIVSVVAVLVVAVAACLVALRRRGGSGERGAAARGAGEQSYAQGLAQGHAQSQNMGPQGG